MLKFVTLLHVAVAHRMMLSWNCGSGMHGGFVNDLPCNDPTVFVSEIQMSDLSKLQQTQGSNAVPSMSYLSFPVEAEFVQNFADLDQKLVDLIKSDQPVVLLGRDFSASSSINSNSAPVKERNILSTDPSPTWRQFPSKNFPACGAIKIAPTFQISGGTTGTFKDVGTWTCDSSTIKLPYTDGTTDKTLEIKMSLNTPQEMKAQYGNWSFTLSADGKDYGKNNKLQAPLTNYGKDNNLWSLTCVSTKLKDDSGAKDSWISIGPYQMQMDGLKEDDAKNPIFGRPYDCTPLMGEFLWVTVIGFFLFIFILGIGIYFLLSIETPPRFESPRSKPLIIPDN